MSKERVDNHSFYLCYMTGIKRTFRDKIAQMIEVTTRNLSK
jgi:hypothetical protein